jgi:hypothetical protein
MEFKNLKALRILTILLAITLTVVSMAGAFVPSIYERDVASMAAQGAGQDLVDLFLVVPLLLISFYSVTRNSKTGTLIFGGTLFYILYSFIIYALGVHFNRLFLLYCATLGLSLYAFILYMMEIRKINISGWFEKAPVNLVSGYIIASLAMVFMIILTIALASMVIMLQVRDISEDLSIAAIFSVLTLSSIIVTILLFRIIKS